MPDAVETDAKEQESTSQLLRPFVGLGGFILRRNFLLLLIVGLLLVFLKTGIRDLNQDDVDSFTRSLSTLPKASFYFHSSYGPTWALHLLRIESTTQWMLFLAGLALLSVLAFWMLARGLPASERAALGLFVPFLPLISAQFTWLGPYDLVVLLGILLWAMSRSTPWVVVGAVVAASGNPEQMVIGSACALLVTSVPILQNFRTRAIVLAGVSVGTFIAVHVWFAWSGFSESRLDIVAQLFKQSAYEFMMQWPARLWGWYGPIWLLVLLVVGASQTWRRRSAFIAGAFLIPAAVNFTTVDGVRVFACLALPVTLMVVLAVAPLVARGDRDAHLLVGVFSAVAIVAPAATSAWGTLGPWILNVTPFVNVAQEFLNHIPALS